MSESDGAARHASLENLTALVTGSSSGIGRAIAAEFAAAGARVILHANRSVAAAHELARELVRTTGTTAPVIQADLSDSAATTCLVEEAYAIAPDIDVWVNNAGADVLTTDLAKAEFSAKLERLWDVDVRATIALTRAVAERMRARGSGVILNMGWDQAERGMEGESGELFGATKGAIMCFTRSAALSFAPEVRINCLAPGWIRTAWGESADDYWQKRVVEETPLARWGTPNDVASAARFLASPDASYITGQIVRVNGGCT